MGQSHIFYPGDRDHDVLAVALFSCGHDDNGVDLFDHSERCEADKDERRCDDLVGRGIFYSECALFT